MKFSVNRERFIKALQRVINCISSRNTLPILSNVLIEAEGAALQLTTTDLELRISTRLEAEILEPGKTTIPGKRLYALVSNFDGETLEIASDERHHAELISGSSHFKLLGISPDDFPADGEFAALRTIQFKGIELKRMLGQIIYAISLNDSRKVLHGMLLAQKENVVTMVATDGKRLALTQKAPDSCSGDDGDCIIPFAAASEIKRQVDPKEAVTLEIGDKQARFTTTDTVLTTKLIEGTYPNYRQVIPSSFSRSVMMPVGALLQKIELVAQVLTDANGCLVLNFAPGELELRGASSEVGEGSSKLAIPYEGDPLQASFNPALLADPLRYADQEEMTFKLNDGFSPVAIEGGDGFLYVIMPMRNR